VRVLPLVALVVSLGLVLGMFSMLGIFDVSGATVDSGLSDEVEETAEEQEASNIDPDEGGQGGFLSFTVSAISNLKSLIMIPVFLPSTLQSLGFPSAFATAVGRAVQFVIALGLMQIATRGEIR
jgi:hypothetical protein